MAGAAEEARSRPAAPTAGDLPLSVVVASREGPAALRAQIDPLVPQIREIGGEIVLVTAVGDSTTFADDVVVHLVVADANMLALRRAGFARARGRVIAVGEDHAVPAPDWAAAIIRAHDEHPDAPAVVGCLVNATDATVAGRANFIGFAAAFTPPLTSIDRPPPVSVTSFKRGALDGAADNPGGIESQLLPRLFDEGQLALDDRIVAWHHQDHGAWWTLTNAFSNTRANYGYAQPAGAGERRAVTRWIVTTMLVRQWREAWSARREFRSVADPVFTALVCLATTAGALVGNLGGPGRAAEHVA